MTASRHRALLPVGVSTLLVTALAQAQTPAASVSRPATERQRSDFMRGYLHELLDQDPGKALHAYRQAGSHARSSDEERIAALIRQAELAWWRDDPTTILEIAKTLATFDVVLPALPPTRTPAVIASLRKPAATDEEKDKARADLLATIMAPANRAPRLWWNQRSRLEQLRDKEAPAQDPEMQRLRQELIAAQKAQDLTAAGRLIVQIRRQQLRLRRIGPQQEDDKRRAEITKRHLSGQHEQAVRWEALLLPQQNGADVTARLLSGLEAKPQRWLMRTYRGIERRLERLIQTRPDDTQERRVLVELRQRLQQLAASGHLDEALRLSARVPYRSELWAQR